MDQNDLRKEDSVYQPEEPNYDQGGSGKNGLAIGSLVLGIISIVLSCTGWGGIVCGIVGIILSSLSKKQYGKSGLATGGMVCSIIGIVITVILIIIGIIAGAAGIAMLNELQYLQ